MNMNIEIGKRLRMFRIEKKLTQTQVGAAAGRSKQLVSAWEAGRAEITIESLARLAPNVGVDPNWLILGRRAANTVSLLQSRKLAYLTADEVVMLNGFPARGSGSEISSFHRFSDSCFAMICPDDALRPRLRRGDLLFVDTAMRPLPNQLAVAVVLAERGERLAKPTVVARRVDYQSITGLEGEVALAGTSTGWPTIVAKFGTDARLGGTIVGQQSVIISRDASADLVGSSIAEPL